MRRLLTHVIPVAFAASVAIGCGETDAGITTDVKARLAADDTVSAYQVDVDTEGGIVTLSGTVETMAARDEAVRIAREAEGVRDVIDNLEVGDTAATSGIDADIDVDDQAESDVRDGANAVGDAAREAGEAVKEGAEAAAEGARRAGSEVRDAVTDDEK